MAQKFYVVWVGRETGVFTSWDYTKKLVDKYPQARYKSFKTREEAESAFRSGVASHKSKRSPGTNKKAIKEPTKKQATSTPVKPEMSDFDINIYSDGACDPNPGEAGSGVAVYSDNRLIELWYGLYNPNGTNNSAELNALYQALLIAKENVAKGKSVQVLSDSVYSINCISVWAHSWKKKGWQRKEPGDIKNLEIIQASHELYLALKDVITLSHVKGHAGIEGNELADRMSVLAVDRRDTDFCRYREPLDIEAILALRAG
ncbi:ribonuclease HI [Photobacterium proteolyticum]|uniref:Ribonuclease H n=1 Tax=Photobacterium proteolyticum TaxID=1903952 RepID=A0A1Q9GIV4_9GAMM|nr:ribonuclease H family protein [Photobacterium proteolyticum]OLQ74340.1 ribonuclease HI [Photobacterium proteolyticum]